MLRLPPVIISGLVLTLTLLCPASIAEARLNVKQFAPCRFHGKAPKHERDFQELKAMGINTVVETRKFYKRKIERERQNVLAHGMNYCHVPMGFWPLRDGTPEQALNLIAHCGHLPVYLHCNLGVDRAGLVIALYRVRYEGWDPGVAFETFKAQQFNGKLKGLDRYFWTRTYE
ncbi:MAG: hypothetical protein JNM18_17540 [Planctomycetaceae bacterium]|nr:hypothetical protein [Planctomycetaceae bacterium]